jgi:phosphoserine aminotransferase
VKINFTPGPSQLFFTVEDHTRKAFREGIPSLSHRTKEFEKIFASVNEGLKVLLNIPAGFHIVFTGSATEIWERIIENLVVEESLHFVNGSFSNRFYETAIQLGRKSTKIEAPEGQGFKPLKSYDATELVALTHNETSTGVALTSEFIDNFRKVNPSALIAVDAVSSLPYPSFDFRNIDSVFFSVQKGFGLPAGLGVWIFNDRCVAKAESLLAQDRSIGSYHSIPGLVSHAQKNQTPETPNVLAIYLLSKVVEDFVRRGITAIRRETEYKAALIYHTLQKTNGLRAFVQDAEHQSQTVIVVQAEQPLAPVIATLQAKGLYPGDGYGKAKASQMRFANFPAHSKEQYELLADSLAAW